MQFGKIATIQSLGKLAGIVVAVILAVCGFGYWALVVRPITTALCIAVGAWLVCPWRPGFPVFDDDVKSMVRFGLHVVGYSVTSTFGRSVDRIALGYVYRPEQVGYYQNAITLYENSIFSVLAQLHTVGSAALSKLQSNPAALRQRYEAALSALAFFVMPASAILSVTAVDVTVILLGEKWRAAGSLLSIIALRGIFQVVEGSQGWLHLSAGRADRWRNWGIISAVVQVVAVLAGLPFGPKGVAATAVVANMLMALPSIIYAGRPIDVGAALVIRAVGPQLVGAISAAALGWWLQTAELADYPTLVRVVLSAGFCTVVYHAVVVGVFRLMEPIKVAALVAKDLLRSRWQGAK
jgi:PST family polysaccharide transporter